MKPGDKITVTSGKLKGQTGIIKKETNVVPGGFICHLTSLQPVEIKILIPTQFTVEP